MTWFITKNAGKAKDLLSLWVTMKIHCLLAVYKLQSLSDGPKLSEREFYFIFIGAWGGSKKSVSPQNESFKASGNKAEIIKIFSCKWSKNAQC